MNFSMFVYKSLIRLKLLDSLTDKSYVKLTYHAIMNKRLDLKNPKTFNEKLQWLKLYNRRPEYTKMVDKYEVKNYISAKIGEEYLIKTLGVWDRFDDIDFDKLPDRFVLKCTHDSGGLVICKDKSKLDKEKAKEKIEMSLKRDYYLRGREWPYKNVPHRIIAEEFVSNNGDDINSGLTDYKFFCHDGQVDNVMLCIDRDKGDPKFYFFDKDWNLLRLNIRGKEAPEGFTLPKPKTMDKMFEVASELSKGIPFVRVDLYSIDDNVKFGEMTFFPQSGIDNKLLPETDILFGNSIVLPEKREEK